MKTRDLFLALVTVLLLLASLWIYKPRKLPDFDLAACATEAEALQALELMKEWGTWLTGIQTAAIAGLAFIIKGRTRAAFFAIIAIAMFGASIIADTALLGNLPRMALRLSSGDRAPSESSLKPCPSAAPLPMNAEASTSKRPISEPYSRRFDIYEMTISETLSLRLGFAYMLSHWYFIFGICAFAAAFIAELTSKSANRRAGFSGAVRE